MHLLGAVVMAIQRSWSQVEQTRRWRRLRTTRRLSHLQDWRPRMVGRVCACQVDLQRLLPGGLLGLGLVQGGENPLGQGQCRGVPRNLRLIHGRIASLGLVEGRLRLIHGRVASLGLVREVLGRHLARLVLFQSSKAPLRLFQSGARHL